ncbi:MAG: 50S ribosomal protein L11 methyltransferase [Desulfomonile tiedjei]|nr:50S ribosomal protein L11 methyltransferase [Desulfomonile tiedjei]
MRRPARAKREGWTGKVRSLDVGENLRLVPYWERGLQKTRRHELIIDPGPSFGAGDHPTTVMALELLERAVAEALARGSSPSMLDVGTGTGVLAIAGRALGTGFTVGLDIDGAAIFTARHNLHLNGLTRGAAEEASVHLFIGGVEAVGGTFTVVAANLAAPTLLRVSRPLRSCVAGLLVLSGIAEAMAEEVLEAYRSAGLALRSSLHRDGWNAALFDAK